MTQSLSYPLPLNDLGLREKVAMFKPRHLQRDFLFEEASTKAQIAN